MAVVKTDALPKAFEEEVDGVMLVVRGMEGKGYYSKASRKYFFPTPDDEDPEFVKCETEEKEHNSLDEAMTLGRLQAKRLARHVVFDSGERLVI
jgi:hypothetical protein